MSTTLGIRDRPGPLGPPVSCPALGNAEFVDYKTHPRCQRLTIWLTAPAAGQITVDIVDVTSGTSGRGAILGTLLDHMAVPGSTSQTPVIIAEGLGGSLQIRVTWTDTSNSVNTVAARVEESRLAI